MTEGDTEGRSWFPVTRLKKLHTELTHRPKQQLSVPEVVQVGDLLHAEPAELTAAHGARHVVAAPIVHLDDVRTTARTRLDVISWGRGREGNTVASNFMYTCESGVDHVLIFHLNASQIDSQQ